MKRSSACVAGALLTLVIAAGISTGIAFGRSAAKPEKVKIVLGYLAGPQHLELLIADKKGFFAQEGLDVTVHSPSNVADAIKLVGSGRDQFGGAVTYPDVIIEHTQGVPVIGVSAPGDRQTALGMMSRKESHIKTPKDLIGKTIGLLPLAGNRARFADLLSRNGIKQDELKIVTVSFDGPQQLAAKKVDAVDAVSWYEGFVYEKLAHEKPDIMYFTKWGVAGGYLTANIANRSWAEKHPATVIKVNQAILKAQQWMLAHPAQADALGYQLLKKGGYSRYFVHASRAALNKLAVDRDTKAHGLGWMNMKVLQTMIDWSANHKLISKPFPAAELFTNKYLGPPVKQP